MRNDISAKRKQLEKSLQENEGLYRHLVESANAVPWEVDLSTWCFTYVGPQAVKLLGYPVEAWYEENFWGEHLHPDDREATISFCQEATAQARDHEFEYRMIAADGREVWIRDSVNFVTDKNGPVSLRGYIFDITTYKQAMQALARSKAEFEAMFKAIPDAVIFVDSERHIVMNNPAVHRMFGYSDEELIGQTTEMLYADKQDFKDQGRRRYRVGSNTEIKPYEIRYKRKDGTVFWTETLGTQVKDANGTIIGFIGMIRDISERKRAEEKIKASEQELRTILHSLQDTYYRVDSEGCLTRVSPSALQLLGYAPQELLGTKLADLYVDPQGREKFLQQLEQQCGAVENYEGQLKHKDGSSVWVSTNAQYIRDEQGVPVGVEGTARDISQLKAAEDLRSRFGRVLDNSSNEIYVFDADTLLFTQVNRGARENLGYSIQEMEQLTPVDIKPDYTMDSFKGLLQPLYRGEQEQLVLTTRHCRKDGSLYPVEVRLQLSKQESPPVFLAIIQDVSERMQNEERLQYLAHHDALTSLPNRVLFMDRLDQSLARAHWHECAVAVLFLDLDRFKLINDSLGHDVGDRALQALSERLNSCVREGDTVARLGGDEFAIVLEDIAAADDVAPTARNILNILSQPFLLDNNELILTTSIGVSLFPTDGEDSQTLLKHADIAMYRAKDEGRNTYQFYSADMSVKAFERLNLETNLRRALERQEFILYYQPQLNLTEERVIGVEALLRWQHPDLGLISPLEFIPMLEETGLIIPVGEWVLRTACLQAQAWNSCGLKPLHLSVNLSGRQTNNSNFIAIVEKILKDSKLDPTLLELEMTESILMHNVQTSIKTLNAISEMGVRLAIDDFGTGYSSLSYLKRFPINTLKIDRSFIHDLTQDPDDATLVEAIIAMGQALQLNVIAEGVETNEQADFLRARNCDVIQGYLFSQPLPAEELTTLLHEQLTVAGKQIHDKRCT